MDTLPTVLFLVLAGGAAWSAWQRSQRRKNHVLENLPGPPSRSFLKGSLGEMFHRHAWPFQTDVALNYGPVVKLRGFLNRPIVFVSDPTALHTMIIKEEHIFEESQSFILGNKLIFGPGLLATLGDQHRKQRKILNPVFSVAHMRNMLPLFYDVIYRLRDAISLQVKSGQSEIDILAWTGRVALELIGQSGLGYSFDDFVSDMKDDYGAALKALFPRLMDVDILQRLLPYMPLTVPAGVRRLAISLMPNAAVQKLRSIVDVMSARSVRIFMSKRKALADGDEAVLEQIGKGKDIMSVLMKANELASENDRLSEEELIGQMSTLVFAAVDTTSNTVARILHILSERPHVQDKLRQEILAAGAHNKFSYDELNKLPFLNAVCRETLRLYPIGTTVMRVPNKDTVLPLSEPVVGVDGTIIKEIPIPKGTEVLVGAWACNIKKSLWGEDSTEWKPERWVNGLPTAVLEAPIPGVYSHLMTFLGGKRACIGFKFSEMEMKVLLSVLLSAFTFEPTGRPIIWNLAGVVYPTTSRESETPEMFLKVGLYSEGAKTE
uniref:Cytochrome P450 n=1 Tax=Rhodonia placenta TaxID=104341 RepID=F1SYF8_9APHY|nr:cytochrome P450 [Postia placenta]